MKSRVLCITLLFVIGQVIGGPIGGQLESVQVPDPTPNEPNNGDFTIAQLENEQVAEPTPNGGASTIAQLENEGINSEQVPEPTPNGGASTIAQLGSVGKAQLEQAQDAQLEQDAVKVYAKNEGKLCAWPSPFPSGLSKQDMVFASFEEAKEGCNNLSGCTMFYTNTRSSSKKKREEFFICPEGSTTKDHDSFTLWTSK